MANKNNTMNRYKVSDVLRMLKEDGWYSRPKGKSQAIQTSAEERKGDGKWQTR